MEKRKLLLVFTIAGLLLLFIAPSAQAAMGSTVLHLGSSGPNVMELQKKLNYVGYNVGKADGKFGLITRQRVLAFQAAKGLKRDGVVGSGTAASLNWAFAEKKRYSIINTAKQYIGVRYQWGGSTPATGFDCSGYTAYVFKQNGIVLPRVSREQFKVGWSVSYANLRPGDLVFFSFANNGVVDHVGIYAGNNQFINAASSKGVTVYTMGPYWQSRFVGARRIV